MSRVALAATLSSTYGIYNGFELLEPRNLFPERRNISIQKNTRSRFVIGTAG